MTEAWSRSGVFSNTLASLVLLAGTVTSATAQITTNPLSGATPHLNQTITLPDTCPLRIIVPLDRSNPAVTVSAAVTVELRWPRNLRPLSLGTPRVTDTGNAMIFTFERPAESCNEPVRVTPTVTCTASMAGGGSSLTDSYHFPSAARFASLSEVTIPRAC